MTTQPIETDTLIDISALVGEMEAIPCESLGHNWQYPMHDSGPADSYFKVECAECSYAVVKAYCRAFTQHLQTGGKAACPTCWTMFASITPLGPVNA